MHSKFGAKEVNTYKTFLNDKVDPFLCQIEQRLCKTNCYLHGDKPMMDDFWVAGLYVNYFNNDAHPENLKGLYAGLKTKYPKYCEFGERIKSQCKNYFDTRGKCPA